jgi:hypothetical protein
MKLSRIIALMCALVIGQVVFSQTKVTISGFVKDDKEELLYAKIFIPEIGAGAISNEYGFYSIEVPQKESYTLVVSYLGYQKTNIVVNATKDIKIDLVLAESNNELDQVEVVAVKSVAQEAVTSTDMSVVRIDIKEAKLLPSIGGETDVLKVAQLLPGINRGGEGGTNFFVRGGDGDQNLILVDEATVYNPGHLFGFFFGV